jgi:putative ABC transport system permease protein
MGRFKRLINVFRPRALSRDLDREMAFHVAETTDALVEGGMSPEAAAREAARRFGHRGSHRERTRDVDILLWLESLLSDLRHAFRGLRASPGFTAVTVLSLGLGIGANTAIFSLLNAVVLRSLPVHRPEQLVKVAMGDETSDVFTNPLWEAIRDRSGLFDGVFAFGQERFNLASGGQARLVNGAFVSGGFFQTLGVQSATGRLLQSADDQRGCAALAVLSYGFWQSEFGGAENVVGTTLSLGSHPFTIIGASGEGFAGVEIGRTPQVYVPICAEPLIHGAPGGLDQRADWWLQLIGRLPEGTTAAQLSARLAIEAPAIFAATVSPDWGNENQQEFLKRTLSVVPAATGLSEVRARYQLTLIALMAVVAVVLLIACANVANLLLARAAARQREMAMRLAIGASRARIVRQVLTESILLSTLGALLGLAFARWSSSFLTQMIGQRGQPVTLDLSPDGRVLVFTTVVAMATGILFGLAPAWGSIRLDPQGVLKVGGAATTATARVLRAGRLLVISQIALALVLVVTAGLLLGTLRALATLNPGFQADGVLLAEVDFQGIGMPIEQRQVAARDLMDRMRALPGARGVSASVITPISGSGWNSFIVVPDYQPTGRMDNLVWFNGVTDGFFSTLGTRLVAGRDFSARDGGAGPRVGVINQSLAKKFFKDANPLGKQFVVQNGDTPGPPIEVIGVVEDAKYRSLRDASGPTVYVPWTDAEHFGSLTFEVRSEAPVREITAGVLEAAHQVMPHASLQVSTLSGQLAASLARERLLATLSGFFGGLALLLALMGLYGTMAYNVTRRRKELGIRVALGATRSRLVRLVLGDVGRMVLIGLLLGLGATFAATRLVASFLYGRTPSDPFTLGAAMLSVAGVALLAGAIPAVRASRQNPQGVLREE